MEEGAIARRTAPAWAVYALVAFIVALVIRLAFVLEASRGTFMAYRLIDEQDYDQLARGLIAGRWPGPEALFRPPLYPMFLAAVYRLFGDDPLTVRLVQAALGSFAAPMTVAIAMRVLRSERQALVAGLLVATCGTLVYYDTQLLAASLDVLLVLATVALLLRADAAARPGSWLLAGAVIGLSATNRGSMLFVLPIAALWAFVVGRRARRSGAVGSVAALVVGALALVGPLAWHNAHYDDRPEAGYAPEAPAPSGAIASFPETVGRLVRGESCALGWAGGINLYMGNDADVDALNRDADFRHFDWFNELSLEPWRHGARTAHEHSAWFEARARKVVAEDPGRWLALMGHKILEVVNGYEVPRGTSPYGERKTSWILSLLIWQSPLRFPSGVLLPLGIAGALMRIRERSAVLVTVVMVAQLVFVVVFFVTARYRAPALPLAAILATGFVAQLVVRTRESASSRPPMAWIVGAVALLVIANIRLAAQSFDRSAIEEYDIAVELGRDKKADSAVPHVLQAIAIAPGFADAHAFLGYLRLDEGDPAAAGRAFTAALALDPDNARVRDALGRSLLERGDAAGAEQAFRMAEEARRRRGSTPGAPASSGIVHP